jgi:hypothetical protein
MRPSILRCLVLKTGRNAVDRRNLGVTCSLPLPWRQTQKANSCYLLPVFGRRANHLAYQFAISCAVGWILANGKWQTPCHNLFITKTLPFAMDQQGSFADGELMFAVLNVDAMVRSSLPHGGIFP